MTKNNILIRSKLKKAQAFIDQGKLHDAKTAYIQIYNTNRNNDDIGLTLAVIHRKLGEFLEAREISHDIVTKSPGNPQAHHIYGSALQCLGDIKGAISEYKLAIQLDPKFTQAHYFLGNIYQISGEMELAATNFNKAIELEPDFFEALNNLGAVLVELHRPIEAKQVLDRAVKLNPNSLQLLCNIAGFHLLDANIEKALHYAKSALIIDPDFVDALKLSGKANYQLPDYDQALSDYRKAYELSNDNELLGYITQILERRGEFDEANKLIKPLIESGNTDYAVLMTYSALGRNFNHQEDAIRLIEEAIKLQKFDRASLVNLHTELGKQYDHLEDYKNAFHNYNLANLLERELNHQVKDLNKTRDLNNTNKHNVDTWFKDYPSEFWKNLPSSDNTSVRPVFVIGMFRSGTTLCEQILASHPDMHGAGEIPDIHEISLGLHNNKFHDQSPASLVNIKKEQLRKFSDDYLKALNKHSADALRVVNKMPTNFFHVGLISKLFPHAKIIHMIRDPRDACTSMFFQRFGSQMTFSTDLEELADYHLAYQRIMQYWQEVLDIKILDVVYEDLVDNQEETTRKMLEFCDLEWNDQCINFHETKRDVNTPSYDQVRKPMYKKSVARWKNYEEFLKPLLDKLDANIDAENTLFSRYL